MNDTQWWIVTTIGIIAALIAIFAFFPQSLKTIKTKKTAGISLLTFIIYTLANAMWVIWAIANLAHFGTSDTNILMKNLIMLCANIPCTLWAAIILGIKINNMIRYGEDCQKNKKSIADKLEVNTAEKVI